MPRAATTLENIQVSLFLGQLRLILPNESLSEAIALNRAACPGNVLLVIESSSVFTSAWNEINLDGLGYPPFNATRLPRRQKSQSQRLGDSTLRLGCKVGNVFGAVADIVRADGRGEAEPSAGIFEAILSQTNGTFFQMHTSGTFLFPFNAALDVEEAHHAPIQRDDMTTKKRRAALSITKARIELQKSEFDAIVGRSLGASRAMLGVLRSPIWRTFVDSTRRVGRVEKESIVSHQVAKAHNVVHEVTCDGIEVALSSTASSIHARIGSMSFYRNFLDRSGGFSIQNVVTGFRCAGDPSCAGNLASREELVFGANADPALWQLGPDNYPEKLLSGRWSSLDGHETTLFLDMQAYQLHLSCHLLEQVSQFVRFTPAFLFTRKASRYVPLDKDPSRDVYRCPKHKTTVKILIAPSVISLWTRNESPSTSPDVSTSVWLSCGQTFVSVGIGADEANRQKLVKANQDAVHELNRYFSVQDMDFMFNLEKIAVKTSSRAPVLGINFRYGTRSFNFLKIAVFTSRGTEVR
uniref:Uncharacterized protein n=1 Tax=Globisporangium ultimum (strain ATCC 200006 / CBS 805.95 / DAOM BR144) TaxID=431595 RepID=K3X2H5_GLOUD